MKNFTFQNLTQAPQHPAWSKLPPEITGKRFNQVQFFLPKYNSDATAKQIVDLYINVVNQELAKFSSTSNIGKKKAASRSSVRKAAKRKTAKAKYKVGDRFIFNLDEGMPYEVTVKSIKHNGYKVS